MTEQTALPAKALLTPEQVALLQTLAKVTPVGEFTPWHVLNAEHGKLRATEFMALVHSGYVCLWGVKHKLDVRITAKGRALLG